MKNSLTFLSASLIMPDHRLEETIGEVIEGHEAVLACALERIKQINPK